ncbi:MAG TPA: hypothetical protein VLC91_07415 [Spongiibacteraceae bacterium]|jgi:hypothetical protein|nr:hypothetical protein [Spongiibacteraceae bacterium]
MSSSAGAALIIDHLGGEKFLAGLGARDFVIDGTHFSFTLVHDNSKGVHSVTISIEPRGGFKVACYGRIVPGSFQTPVLATESVAIPESLAAVLGKLTGIDTLRHRHL